MAPMCGVKQSGVGVEFGAEGLKPGRGGGHDLLTHDGIGFFGKRQGELRRFPKLATPSALRLAATPAFHLVDPDVEHVGLEGDRLSLPCDAAGLPPPSMSWSRGDDPGLDPKANPLQFVRASKESTDGVWTCNAENEFGKDSVSVKVNVVSKTTMFAQDLIQVTNTLCPVII